MSSGLSEDDRDDIRREVAALLRTGITEAKRQVTGPPPKPRNGGVQLWVAMFAVALTVLGGGYALAQQLFVTKNSADAAAEKHEKDGHPVIVERLRVQGKTIDTLNRNVIAVMVRLGVKPAAEDGGE